jgi:hypothetical protein
VFAVDLAVGTALASERPLAMPSQWLAEITGGGETGFL